MGMHMIRIRLTSSRVCPTLQVHQPLWSLQGFFAAFDAWRGDASSGADVEIRSAPAATLQQAHGAAKAALTSVMLTDAPLIHPPGLLALAAMQTGFVQVNVSLLLYPSRSVAVIGFGVQGCHG